MESSGPAPGSAAGSVAVPLMARAAFRPDSQARAHGPTRRRRSDSGRSYVASCRRILDDIAEAERSAAGEYLTPRGELTISVSQIMGRVHVMPVVEAFVRAFPDIRMRVLLN